MSEATITVLVLAAAVALFLWDRLPVAIVATGIALSLCATGVLDWSRRWRVSATRR